MKGKLYLIPSTIGETAINDVIPIKVSTIINSIDYYIVENERTARRYLKRLGIVKEIDELSFFVLDKHQQPDFSLFLKPIAEGKHVGVLSEAGCPCVADPGSDVVKIAHRQGIEVIPLVGPSSIIMALMASGMNGQGFAFTGYLPVKKEDLMKKIRFLETRSSQEKQTQIFIEAPYRNMNILDELIKNCHPNTLLCIACDITLETEFIKTKTIKDWRNNLPDINKRPAIFLLHKYS